MLHEIGTYIPEEALWFVGGMLFLIVLSGIFTLFTNSEDDYNIDLRVEIFKNKIKKAFRKIFKKRKKVSKDQTPKIKQTKEVKKMTKKEIKKELNKMFED